MTATPAPVPKPKRPERPSAGRRSIEAMANFALKSGAASSVEDLLDQVAAIPGRKLFNALLAVLQLPHATMLCGAAEWETKWRRRIKPEERPLVLLFPFGPVEFVFDVSQTESTDRSRQLPLNATPFAMESMRDAGQLVARLSSAAEELGVRVVSARQGVALAGKIRRADGSGVIRVPAKQGTSEPREVAERWVVALNQSHSATEQLATLAHELGHLFCGHVGADQGDSWPNREVREYATREFEAESVARLVFRRLAPDVALPPYLERILDPGEPPPDQGWTYVAQASDRVVELVGTVRAAGEGEVASTQDVPLPWTSDLVVRRGGPDATEVILVRATKDAHGLPERIGAAWAEGASALGTPWIAVARTAEAFDGVMSSLREAPGVDPDHDLLVSRIDAVLPVSSSWLTVVEAGDPDQETLVELSTDPPSHGGDIVSACVDAIRRSGVSCVEPELDESWMSTELDYATGGRGFEQVLGWDDMYTDEQWAALRDAQRLFVRIRPDAGLVEPRVVELVANAVSSGRKDVDDYYAESLRDSADAESNP